MRLGDTLGVILSAHDYPPRAAEALGEALVLTALIGSALKGDGAQATVQAKAKGGAIGLLVCDYRAGELRGYLQHDPAALSALNDNAALPGLFGEGYLAVTLDPGAGQERYQGIVPLEGADLATAFSQYFQSSEQIPTMLRAAVRQDEQGGWHAGGLLVQHLPRGEEGQTRLHADDASDGGAGEDWAHLSALSQTVTAVELTDPDLDLETLLWRLFNEDDVRLQPPVGLSRGCRCSIGNIETKLKTFPEAEKVQMRDDDGLVRVDCEFCSRQFEVAI